MQNNRHLLQLNQAVNRHMIFTDNPKYYFPMIFSFNCYAYICSQQYFYYFYAIKKSSDYGIQIYNYIRRSRRFRSGN